MHIYTWSRGSAAVRSRWLVLLVGIDDAILLVENRRRQLRLTNLLPAYDDVISGMRCDTTIGSVFNYADMYKYDLYSVQVCEVTTC